MERSNVSSSGGYSVRSIECVFLNLGLPKANRKIGFESYGSVKVSLKLKWNIGGVVDLGFACDDEWNWCAAPAAVFRLYISWTQRCSVDKDLIKSNNSYNRYQKVIAGPYHLHSVWRRCLPSVRTIKPARNNRKMSIPTTTAAAVGNSINVSFQHSNKSRHTIHLRPGTRAHVIDSAGIAATRNKTKF